MNAKCVSPITKREQAECPDGKSLELHLRVLLSENLKIPSNNYKYHTSSDNTLDITITWYKCSICMDNDIHVWVGNFGGRIPLLSKLEDIVCSLNKPNYRIRCSSI